MPRTVPAPQASPVDPLAGLVGRLPDRPAPSLDRALDATALCLARHGLARTSMTDVAKEMGVARSTLYRSISSVEEAASALLARDTWRFFDEFGDVVVTGSGPEAVVGLTARFVRFAIGHPVVARLLHDEPDFVGRVMSGQFAALVDRAAQAVTPLMSIAMDGGLLARRDPRRLAQWLARVVVICILAPPQGDLEEFLEEMLMPVLSTG